MLADQYKQYFCLIHSMRTSTIYKCKHIHIFNIDAYMLVMKLLTYKIIMTKNER